MSPESDAAFALERANRQRDELRAHDRAPRPAEPRTTDQEESPTMTHDTGASSTETTVYGYEINNGIQWPDDDGDLETPGDYVLGSITLTPPQIIKELKAKGVESPKLFERITSTVTVERPWEPPLPTEPGAIIRATITGRDEEIRTLLALTAPKNPSDYLVWMPVSSYLLALPLWFAPESFRDVEVLFDPEALAAELTAAAAAS